MRLWLASAWTFLAACASAPDPAQVQAVEQRPPAIGFSGVQADLGGEPTRVLVLGTSHLDQVPEGAIEEEHLALVRSKLEAFAPDIIAIEAVGGRTCDGAVARHYVAWWQTRGLRMAANIVEAAGNLHDIELVSVPEVLGD